MQRRLDHLRPNLALLCPPPQFAPQRLRQLRRKVAHDSHVHADIVLLRRARKGERVPLPVAHLGTVQEHVLPSPRLDLLLLDLDLAHLVRVEDNFRDVCAMAGAHLAADALGNVEEPANEPVLPKHPNLVG